MNEDDTFRKLKRQPYEQVTSIYAGWWLERPDSTTNEEADAFLAPYGWTFDELFKHTTEKFSIGRRTYIQPLEETSVGGCIPTDS